MKTDGKIIIGTEVDTSGVEDGLIDIEQITQRIEQKIGQKVPKEMTESIEKEVSDANDIIQKFIAKLDEYNQAKDSLGEGGVIFEKDVLEVQKLKQEVSEMIPLVNELTEDNIIIPGINDAEVKIPSLNAGLKEIGKNISSVVKKIAGWALALFGIRSAYNAIRNAINVISQDDDQLKADIDYMKNALAYALEPIVRTVVNLIKQMLIYIGWIIKQWTGKNIFENANKSLKKSVGSAKELKKQLAGFDEMNVLQDTSSSGGGGGNTAPGLDLAKDIENLEPPKWLVVIKEIGQWIIDNWQTVVFGLLLTKLFIDLLTGNWIGVIIDLIGLLVIGFFKIKDAIIAIWEGLKVVLATVGKWIYENIIVPVADFFKKLWDGIKDGVSTAVKWVKDKFKSIVDFFSGLISKIVNLFKTIGTKVGDAISVAFKAVINGVLKAIENILNFPIKSINKLIDVINAVPGIDIKTLPTFKLPRLAKGGIINMPGKGVPIGGGLARGGEIAPEGVIPLTDSQQMALLGEAIGKYININATVPVYVGNRMIAKELKRINAEDDFAYNR